ncbi:MAG: polyamine aminopropyltransferase [Acidobacteria bacterium]|nr:polyamine aminopropyltransferase [Acidobacteriota bacterium]
MIRTSIIFLNVLIIATCGLVYELLAGTLASYVLGDSVTQFSLIIGIYLSAMGVGAWLSGFIEKDLAQKFIEIEIAVAILGGFSAPILFLSFARLSYFHIILYLVVFLIGVLVGLELPLLMRILKDQLDFKDLVSRVLTIDYIGALVASLMFPLFLVPKLGLVRTSLVFGLLNVGIGFWATWTLEPLIKKGLTLLRIKAIIVAILLLIGLIGANKITSLAEDNLFADDIIYSRTSSYQRIVVTKSRAGFQLFLNGNLQFSSADEYRYHEALVHPAMVLFGKPKKVLVLGGGDGLGLREILKSKDVESVTLVDLDPAMTQLAANFPMLVELNDKSISDPRVKVINQDAMIWLEDITEKFDVVIIDFPDPNTFALGKLYSTRFYRLLRKSLNEGGTVAVQCTSPLFARTSYWCIVRTIEAAGFSVKPYQTAVPAFGVWGFALAKVGDFEIPKQAPKNLRFLNDETLVSLFTLSADTSAVAVEINRLDNQILVRYYESEWRRYQ